MNVGADGAIEFAGTRFVGRTGGGNAVRSAAYNLRGIIVDQRTGQNYNFTHRDAALHHEILVPAGSSSLFQNAWRLWNAVEAAEKRKDARVAKEIVLGLPVAEGLSKKDWIALSRRFAEENFVSKGVAVQIDIHHTTQGSPHAHLLVTTRRIEGNRLAAKKARDLDPVVRWGNKGRKFVPEAQQHGKLWAQLQNRYFREQGYAIRVDPTAAHPEIHVGIKRRRGKHDQRQAANEEIKRQNMTAAQDPEQVIAALTRTKATFTEREVGRFLAKAGLDKAQVADMRDRVMGHSSLAPLYDVQTGDLAERYTTKAIRSQENRVMAEAMLVSMARHRGVKRPAPTWMHEDQKRAYEHALSPGGLKIIEGRAGTGKTAVLRSIRAAYDAAGYHAVGMGPTNTVASDMRTKEGFTEARTAHSWLFRLKNDMTHWSRRTVVIVDEAAMQATDITEQVLRHAKDAGAKVILAGDDRQLGSIERGGMFTQLAAAHGAVEITEVVRQHEDWQKQASQDLAAGRFGAAVEALDVAGAIDWSESMDGAMARLVAAWAADTKEAPDKSRFAFAWTNDDVDTLNAELRAVRMDRGELGPDVEVQSARGVAPFAIGDRVQFTKTEKRDGIYNGETGTVVAISEARITTTMDSRQLVSWDPREFHGFRHGYAGTIYRGQGATLDAAYVLHSGHWRAPAAYVGLTRQRETIRLFVANSVAVNQRELAEQMGRPEQRDASLRWSDNREEAVRMSVDYGEKLRAEEARLRQEQAKEPAGSDLEFWGREVVSGYMDYVDAWTRIWQAEAATQPPGYNHDELAKTVDNKLEWAVERGEKWSEANEANRQVAADRLDRWDEEFRATATPAQWAAQIARGNADIPEALRALRGSRTDDETTYRAMQDLELAMRQGHGQSRRRA